LQQSSNNRLRHEVFSVILCAMVNVMLALFSQVLRESGGLAADEAESVITEAVKSLPNPFTMMDVDREIRKVYLARGYAQYWPNEKVAHGKV
jgi:hypothetical protein